MYLTMWLLRVDAGKVVDVIVGPEKSGPFLFPDAPAADPAPESFQGNRPGAEKNQSEGYCGERERELVSAIAE